MVGFGRAQAQRDAAATGRQPPGAVERLLEASGKLELLDKMLLRLLPSGHRVLIYSQFTTVSIHRLPTYPLTATESVPLETTTLPHSGEWRVTAIKILRRFR